MSTDNNYQIVGNLAADPELRFTPAGKAVCNFTIVATARYKKGDQWVDGDSISMRCSIWQAAAENVAETLTKGTRVIAVGKLKQRSFETREGEKRTVMELDVDEVGPSLKWVSARVNRSERAKAAAPVDGDDPWTSAAPASAVPEEAPF